MAIEGKKINELATTATVTAETVVPVVVVDQGVAAVEAQKVTIQRLSEHVKDDIIPDQSGQAGKFLSTDGTSVTWEEVQDPSVFYVEDTSAITATIKPEWNHEPGTTIIVGKAQIGGADVTVSGTNALATGSNTNATGIASHAEGIQTIAGSQLSVWNSTTEYHVGDRCIYGDIIYEAKTTNTGVTPVSGSADWNLINTNAAQHSEGNYTIASGIASHAEGFNTNASGMQAHTEGNHTQAIGDNSHAEGYYTETQAESAHAEGVGTVAASTAQHVQGKYNIADASNVYADIIGSGTDASHRDNIQTTTWAGNFWTKGTITDGSGNVLSNKIDKTTAATISTLGLVRPDGSTITIDASGTISGTHGSGVETLHFDGIEFTENYATVKGVITTNVPVMVIQNNGPRLMQINYDSATTTATFTGVTDEKEYTLSVRLNDTTEVASCSLTIVDLQKLFQFTTMPTASATYANRICQYLGTDTSSYKKGYFYACINNGGSFSWSRISVQPEAASFASITGQPTDNTNLATALNAKQDNLTAGSHITINNNTVATAGLQETLTPSTGIRIDNSNNISATTIDDSFGNTADVVINSLAFNTTYQLGVVDSITIADYSPDPTTTEKYEETTIYFTTGLNGTTVTLPVGDSIIWATPEPPEFGPGKRCIICIVNGLALTGGN